MKHDGIVKSDALVSALNWVGIPIAFLYFIDMFISPFVENALNWEEIYKCLGKMAEPKYCYAGFYI